MRSSVSCWEATLNRYLLWAEADGHLPERFGDCRINWGFISAKLTVHHSYREMLTLLAGPAAEAVYRDAPLVPSEYAPWAWDWTAAGIRASAFTKSLAEANRQRELAYEELLRSVASEQIWPAIAAVADELLAHEQLDQEQLASCLQVLDIGTLKRFSQRLEYQDDSFCWNTSAEIGMA